MDFSSLLRSLKECARPGCQTKFIPEGGRTDFCSDLCVTRNNQQKGRVDTRPNYPLPAPPKQRKPVPTPPRRYTSKKRPTALCPHDTKQTFVTPELAWEFIDTTFPDDHVIHPYRCECGAIHIGHYGRGERFERTK